MSKDREQPDGYEPPQVEDVAAEDGPAVTAADGTNVAGAEWRPPRAPGGYEAPEVEDVPATDGPAVTATATTGMF
jgi:hypothetical protein